MTYLAVSIFAHVVLGHPPSFLSSILNTSYQPSHPPRAYAYTGLDREDAGNHIVRVRVADGGSIPLTAEVTLPFVIADANDNTPQAQSQAASDALVFYEGNSTARLFPDLAVSDADDSAVFPIVRAVVTLMQDRPDVDAVPCTAANGWEHCRVNDSAKDLLMLMVASDVVFERGVSFECWHARLP